ncbi:MAG: sugar ABC transporter permease [Candidatus Bathyarchaeia archaeon]
MSTRPPKSVSLLANLPINILLYVTLIVPFILMIYLAFLAWNPAGGYEWWQAPIAGLNNFIRAFSDARFIAALGRTVLFTMSVVGVEFLLGLVLAYLLLGEFRGKRAALSVIIYPLMLPWVVVALIFYLFFQDYGPVNNLFLKGIIGEAATNIHWFLSPTTAFITLLIADIWQWTPFMFLILYSGLSAVSKRLIEAAQVLGASNRTIFWRIQLPLIRPLILVALVLRALEAFKVFDIAYVMTGGGPGTSTETLSLYIYRVAIEYHDISYAAALSLIILIILVAVIRVFIWYSFERR